MKAVDKGIKKRKRKNTGIMKNRWVSEENRCTNVTYESNLKGSCACVREKYDIYSKFIRERNHDNNDEDDDHNQNNDDDDDNFHCF